MPTVKATVLRLIFEMAIILLGVYVAWEQLFAPGSYALLVFIGVSIGRASYGMSSVINGKGAVL